MTTTNLKSGALAIHPRPRSATCSRAISPAASRKHTPRKSKSPASPSSSRASKQDDSDDSSGEQSSAPCLSNSNRGEQLATPDSGNQAGGKRKRASSTRYSENKQLPSWKSDQPTGVLRAPAKPMVQPQLAAPSAEPALLLLKCGCSAHADCRRPTIGDRPGDGPRFGRGRGRSPVPVPDLSAIGDAPPSPSPICQGRGRSPVPDSHRGVRALPERLGPAAA